VTAPVTAPVAAPVTANREPQGKSWWRRLGPPLIAVALLVALDLWSKSAVFAWLLPQPAGMVTDTHGHLRYPLLGEWFTFYLSWNPGMAWGVTFLPPWLLVGGRVVAVLFLGGLLLRVDGSKRVLQVALVLILAGALGNLYDNLFMEPRSEGASFGEVRDFIDVYFAVWDWHFPTFNVADSCITVGAVLLFGSSFFGQEDRE
jgi:signal peptidase II